MPITADKLLQIARAGERLLGLLDFQQGQVAGLLSIAKDVSKEELLAAISDAFVATPSAAMESRMVIERVILEDKLLRRRRDNAARRMRNIRARGGVREKRKEYLPQVVEEEEEVDLRRLK